MPKSVGQWVARLRRAFPDVEPVHVLDLARRAANEEPLAFTRRLAEYVDEARVAELTKSVIRAEMSWEDDDER
jgi:hypothetical protein